MEAAIFKIFGWIINIDFFITIALLIAIMLLYTKWKRGGRRLLRCVGFVILITVVIPVGQWGLVFLENRFQQISELPEDCTGIILLGGSFDRPTSLARGVVSYNITAGRFIAFTELANSYPEKKLLFTGGGVPMSGSVNEAKLAQGIWRKIGFDSSRVMFETRSKSTYENATLSYDFVKPQKTERWALVTTAIHMPRAVALFRKAGWNIVPYPVDYHTSGKYNWRPNFSLQGGFMAWQISFREFAGLCLNYWTGKSDAWIPE